MTSTDSVARAGRARTAIAAAVLAGLAALAAGCAGRAGSAAPGPTRSTPRSPVTSVRPATDRGPGVPAEPGAPRSDSATVSPVCAGVAQLYAGLVAGPLGLGDDADPADRQALATATAAVRAQVPAAVGRDLDVLAQAYGAATRALDDAGDGTDQLDQAVTAVTAPAVSDAVHDLDRYLQARCP